MITPRPDTSPVRAPAGFRSRGSGRADAAPAPGRAPTGVPANRGAAARRLRRFAGFLALGAVFLLAGCGGGGSGGGGGLNAPVNQLPRAKFQPDRVQALTGDVFKFDPGQSDDPDGAIVKYIWDFHYDGLTLDPELPSAVADVAVTSYANPGLYTVALQVTDDQGGTDLVTQQVLVADHQNALQVIPDSLDFAAPDVPEVGQAVARTVYVYNGGNTPVNVTGAISDRDEVTPGSLPATLTVQPQEAAPIPVTFTSYATAAVTGNLAISLDPTQTVVVPFSGSAHSGFTRVGNMGGPRKFHTATLLNDGRVLIVGGEDAANQILDTVEVYDPDTHSFSPGPPLSSVAGHDPNLPNVFARSHHTATRLANGSVLIAGGEYADPGTGNRKPHPSGVVFVPGTISISGSDEWSFDFRITARTQHQAVRVTPGGAERVVLIGGRGGPNAADPLDSVEVITSNGTLVVSGTLSEPRAQHAAVALDERRVLVAGGAAATVSGATAGAEVLDAVTGATTPLSLSVARYDLTLTAVAQVGGGFGWLAVGGGQVANPSLRVVEAYADAPERFVQTVGLLAEPRRRHAAVDLGGGRGLLVVGGIGPTQLAVTSAEIVSPDGSGSAALADRPDLARGNGHRATRLGDGSVLITGGVVPGQGGAVAAAELYVPEP